MLFSTQFKNISGEAEKFTEGEKKRKGGFIQHVVRKRDWTISDESGEYPLLPLLVGIFNAAYHMENGPLFLFIQA